MYLQVGNDDPPGPDTTDETQPDAAKLLERYEWLAERSAPTDGTMPPYCPSSTFSSGVIGAASSLIRRRRISLGLGTCLLSTRRTS